MKAFTIKDTNATEGIQVDMTPYPRVVLGEGGNKRATWIPIGRRDQPRLLNENNIIMGADVARTQKGTMLLVAPRPADGRDRALVLWKITSGYRGGAEIHDNPRGEQDLLHWQSNRAKKPEECDGYWVWRNRDTLVAQDVAYHSGRGALGETHEALAIMNPGDTLWGRRTGRHVQSPYLRLKYLGEGKFEIFEGDKAFIEGLDEEDEHELL